MSPTPGGLQVNTGLPILKIGWESLVGSLAGGGCVYAITYLVYAINGSSAQPGVLKVGQALHWRAVQHNAGQAYGAASVLVQGCRAAARGGHGGCGQPVPGSARG